MFRWLCKAATLFAISVLFILVADIVRKGVPWLSFDFLNNFPSRRASEAGIKSALWGTIWLLGITAAFAIPCGIATAIFLEEYASKNFFTRFLKVNIGNLAGMPSIVYGLIGLSIFVRFFNFERSVLSGGLTLAILVLPVIVIAAQESIKAVPVTLREAAFALGARKWQVVFLQVLPAALPGVMTGVILAISRAVGETAPLIVIGAVAFAAFVPQTPYDSFAALPNLIYNWASRPQDDFHGLAAAGILVLLGVLFTMNLGAIIIRQRMQRYK